MNEEVPPSEGSRHTPRPRVRAAPQRPRRDHGVTRLRTAPHEPAPGAARRPLVMLTSPGSVPTARTSTSTTCTSAPTRPAQDSAAQSSTLHGLEAVRSTRSTTSATRTRRIRLPRTPPTSWSRRGRSDHADSRRRTDRRAARA
ncbi:hypothetical protein QJS66_05275 [Kocuria rhizophila]|nr:hypothetical protein QJS66_05275 [Kocuria rhizophila]